MALELQEKVAWLALSTSTLNTEDLVELKFALRDISDKATELHGEIRQILTQQRKMEYKREAKQ